MTTNPNDLLACPLCGADVTRKRALIPIQVGSRSVPVEGEYSTCAGCGEIFFGPGEMDFAMRAASSVVRQEEGLLQPEEILAIRESLDYSQADFERLLGVGPKTVVRWEKGTVFQNGATDSLLRVIRDIPGSVAYLCARAKLPPRVSPLAMRAQQTIVVEHLPVSGRSTGGKSPVWPLMRKHRVSATPGVELILKLHRGAAA